MSFRPRRRHIIIIKGIRLADLLTTVTPQVSHDSDDEAISFYEETPTSWSAGDELQPIELKCWNCDCQTNGPVAFIPMNPRRSDGKMTFDRFGVYCSWPCAARDAYHRFGGRREYQSIIHSMAEVFYMVVGVDVPCVKMAPEKNVMAEYCGNGGLSRGEYREALRSIVNDMTSK
jgi:hypothetical protein